MSRRERRKRAARVDRSVGIALAVLGLMLTAALGGGAWWLRSTRVTLDPTTLCPSTGPTLVHVILIDRSDPISGQQAQRIKQVIAQLKAGAQFGTRFDVYTFGGDDQKALMPVLTICSPGRPQDANPLIENPDFIRRRYDEQFSSMLDHEIDSLLEVSTQPRSPIIESLRAAAITSLGGLPNARIPRDILMISDMVQHTALYSQFRSDSDFAQLSRSPVWASMRPDLHGADVGILYLLRPSALRHGRPIQNRGHQLFWEQLIRESDGRLVKIEPI